MRLYLHIPQPPQLQVFTNNRNSVTSQRIRERLAVRPLRGCDEALTALQRGCRCNATTAPLQGKESLTAKKRTLFMTKFSMRKRRKSALRKSRKGLTGLPDTLFHAKNREGMSQKGIRKA